MEQLTEKEMLIFSILKIVGDDIESTKKAMEFISERTLKYQLFTTCFNKLEVVTDIADRTDRAIADATNMLTLFN